ncbi:putative FMN-dependent luciferase-like monooxygenase [Pantoea sp.]|uniref:putative FMN-dependent luciferase-like monooxygenase n=1 Tax=Pantoea sp. TaxID=69393 RepID=UPI0031E3F081
MTRKRIGFFTRLLDDTTAQQRYRLATEQIQHAERNGFDSAWIAQHHFHEHEGGLPSPLLFLAHVAAHTRTIRLGTAIITLAMENALRVAEDAAVLDLLSNGRLEVGLGSGGTPTSFLPFGLTIEQRASVFTDHLHQLLSAWRGDTLAHPDNRLYPAAPTLAQRVWIATFSVDGAALAGQAGHGLMLSRTQPRPADQPDLALDQIQNPMIDAYLAALPAGVTPRILASRTTFVADSTDYARRLAKPNVIADAHYGDAKTVLASLLADSTLQRATDISFQVHSIDPPHADILRSIELIAEYIAPALRALGPA